MSEHRTDQTLAEILRSWEDTLQRLDAQLRDLDDRRESLRLQRATAIQTVENLRRIGASHGATAEPSRRTHFDRIVAYFRSVGNEPQMLSQLAIGTRIPRSTVSTILYRTHRSAFVKHKYVGSRLKAWQLTEGVLKQAGQGPTAEVPF